MPSIQSSHSFSLNGRITIMAKNIQETNAREGKNRKEATPNKKLLLKTAAFALGWLYVLNKPFNMINKKVVTSKGAENWFHSGKREVINK